MAIVLGEPGGDGLGGVVGALREWQYDGGPAQLHPGDLGWFWRFGTQATAAAVRTWSRDGRILAVGLVDHPGLLRLAIAPPAQWDEELAQRLVEDVTKPERGVLAEGEAHVDASMFPLVQDLLCGHGWNAEEPWAPLRRDLTEPVVDPGVRVEVIGPERAHVRTAVQRASFDGSTFTDERWHVMAAGLPYADARCLVAYDDQGNPVAAATVWSAGPGKPGLLEPMGVHREHRRLGYGEAITVAAAASLQELGASSAIVCTRAPMPVPSPLTSQLASNNSPKSTANTGTPSTAADSCLADQGVVACKARVDEPAGSCLVSASLFEPAGGVTGPSFTRGTAQKGRNLPENA